MNIDELKRRIEFTYNNKISHDNCNTIIRNCVDHREMSATVYMYDYMIKNGLKPSDDTLRYINKLHSKTIPESNKIQIKYSDNKKRLAPRRRIHKIMKGYFYSDKYNNAKQHEEKVRNFLDANSQVRSLVDQRIKLAKIISKNCDISFNDARFIITSLKRKKYFKSNTGKKQKSITDFFIKN